MTAKLLDIRICMPILNQITKHCVSLKWLILIVIFYSSGISLNAQTQLDSLHAIWQDKAQVDSVRTKAYYQYIWEGFLYSNPDSALVLAKNLVKYGKDHKYSKAKNFGYNIQGIVYKNKSDYPKAMEFQEKGLELYKKQDDKKNIASTLHNMAIIYRRTGNHTKAFKCYNQSIEINKEINNQKGIANSLAGTGVIYNIQGNYPKAIICYNKGLKINEQLGDQSGIADFQVNIGAIYFNQGDDIKALEYFNESLNFYKAQGNQYRLSEILNNIGLISSLLQIDQAEKKTKMFHKTFIDDVKLTTFQPNAKCLMPSAKCQIKPSILENKYE